jgi:hypothetical protein
MSDQYISDFISERILDYQRFSFDEFDDFTARGVHTCIPLFRHMDGLWDLKFTIIGEKLTWEAIQYGKRGYDDHGIVEMSGFVRTKIVPSPEIKPKLEELDIDDDAIDFVQLLFDSKVVQMSVRNVFMVNLIMYDFDYMSSANEAIEFEFISD